MSKIDENLIYKTAYEVIVDALDWSFESENSNEYSNFVFGVSKMVNALKEINDEAIDTEENDMENE